MQEPQFNAEMQRKYWNRISKMYSREMHISLTDFHYGPQIPGENKLHLLPKLKAGMTALELGCGGGENSIYLANKGLICDAFDISENRLERARERCQIVNFMQGDLDNWPKEIKGEYDLIHSSHAMEFALHPDLVILNASRHLKPGGTLAISTVHPLYNGDWLECEDGTMGLFLKNYFTPSADIRYKQEVAEVFSLAYPISSWVKWYRQAGLNITALEEPPEDPKNAPYTNEDWANNDGELSAIPATLIIIGQKC